MHGIVAHVMGRGIELEMLEREGQESQPLWWLGEVVLSILFEPLDWLFTARDLLQGDLTALIGFLPLIPGSLCHIFDAATGLKIDDIACEVGGRLDEWKKLDNVQITPDQPFFLREGWTPTGNNRYDTLRNEDFDEWKRYMESIGGVNIINDKTFLDSLDAGGVTIPPGTWDDPISVYYSSDSTYIDLLHEKEHVDQLIRLRNAGISWTTVNELLGPGTDPYKALKDYMEKEVREFEIELGIEQNFTLEFLNKMHEETKVWTDFDQEIYSMNANLQRLIDIIRRQK